MSESEIKLTPLIDTVQFINMSDEEYFSAKYADYISNSRLSLINPSQDGSTKRYMEGFSGQSYNPSFEFGSAVHEMVLQPEEFYLEEGISKPTAKLGATVDSILSFRKKGYSITKSIVLASNEIGYYKGKLTDNIIKKLIKEGLAYYLFLIHYTPQEDKLPIFLNVKDQVRLKDCITSIKDNKVIQKLLNPDFIFTEPINVNEGAIFMDVKAEYKGKEYILKLKAKLDNFIIDFESKTLYLNDLKTTGHYLSKFTDSFTNFHYYRQMAMYFWMLRMYVMKEYPDFTPTHFYANMLVVSTIPSHESGVFRVNVEDQKKGMEEFGYLLRCIVKTLGDERDLDLPFSL